MNRLFAKIFFWFWLTSIAVVMATAIATVQFNRSIGGDPLKAHFQRTQSAYAQAANSILDTQGLGGLGVWMGELQGPGGARGSLQLLNDMGQAVFGPSAAHDISAVLAPRERGVAPPATIEGVFIDPIYGPDGERFWFVSDMRPAAHMNRIFHMGPRIPGIGGFRLLLAVLVSGVVCYGLARYLTKPIRRLQAASAEIANGNFNVRIDDGRRRDELGDLGRDFDRMAAHLERLQTSQQQLLRDVSHELRSPLARLQVAVGLALQRGDEKVLPELERIEREAEALEELIAQLLSVARLESGATTLAHEDVVIDELLELIVHDANYESGNDNKVVTLVATNGAVVIGDSTLLKSAIENVVRNALTHTPEASEVEITAALASEEQAVSILVRDHGPGVAEEMIGELFKPFVRGDYARDRESGGYGIGLAIADAAIQRHGGRINARNHPNGGFCVEINLPCKRRESERDT